MDFEIIWTKAMCDYFIYGSRLTFFESGEVRFENRHASPGTVLIEWSSEASYGRNRTALQLPLLHRGHTYSLEGEAEVEPQDSVALKFNSFDRTETLVSTQIFPLQGGEVFYPEEAYSYSIELISTGVEVLNFKKIQLSSGGGDG